MANVVILIHGLSLNSFSMQFIEKSLERKSYLTINLDYPSRKYSIEELAFKYIKPMLDKCKHFTYVHIVTHSMGGVIIKYLLDKIDIPNLGRIVMLSPPHKGSELVDFFESSKFLKWFLGPAWLELKKHEDGIKLPEFLRKKIGIIMGNKAIEPFFSKKLPMPNDGIVSLESVELTDIARIILPCNHINILWNKKVIEQINSFIKIGKFQQNSLD